MVGAGGGRDRLVMWSVVGVLHFYWSVVGFYFLEWLVAGVLISIWSVVGGSWSVVGGWSVGGGFVLCPLTGKPNFDVISRLFVLDLGHSSLVSLIKIQIDQLH